MVKVNYPSCPSGRVARAPGCIKDNHNTIKTIDIDEEMPMKDQAALCHCQATTAATTCKEDIMINVATLQLPCKDKAELLLMIHQQHPQCFQT